MYHYAMLTAASCSASGLHEVLLGLVLHIYIYIYIYVCMYVALTECKGIYHHICIYSGHICIYRALKTYI